MYMNEILLRKCILNPPEINFLNLVDQLTLDLLLDILNVYLEIQFVVDGVGSYPIVLISLKLKKILIHIVINTEKFSKQTRPSFAKMQRSV